MHTLTLLASLVGSIVIIVWRIRETQRPVTAVKILAPPLGMSTGFCMFLAPQTRVPVPWGLAAFLVGALFLSYPLVHTSRLTRSGEHVLLRIREDAVRRQIDQAIEADPTLTRLTADLVNDTDIHAACLSVVERSDLSEERGAAEFRAALASIREAEQRLAPIC